MIIEFSFKLVYATMVERNFQIYGVNIPRKCIESAFLLTPPPPPLQPLHTQNSHPASYHHPPSGRGKLLIPPGSVFSKTCFTQK